jgi:hypothetical protein
MELFRVVIKIGFSLREIKKIKEYEIFLLTFKPSVKMAKKS